ncbi:MAG: aminoglycoside phosphotransferase family protein [Pyrinomonadaceae bacterium]
MNEIFLENAVKRLDTFLIKNKQSGEIELLTPDASTREYFRINWKNKTAIACLYPESFTEREHNFLDVTKLFLACDLPVAEIYTFDGEPGVIVLEDLGDTILREVLQQSGDKENYINKAISLIAKIQAATPTAYELDSIASRLKFDEEKLSWELNFFKTHYFETLKKQPLSAEINSALNEEFTELSRELESRAEVLCHRDFHAANLMIDAENRLRIIDHQDARIGAASYDLVSLLLDRVLDVPANDWLGEKKRFLLSEREKSGLKNIEFESFDDEFQLQTIQRCLKAIGTFSFQSAMRGKIYFIPFIAPMFRIVLQAAKQLNRFPTLRKVISEII